MKTCKACNTSGDGMINLFLHPNNIDSIFTELTKIEVLENDCICILCYDDMKIANNFRLKCIQSDLIRRKQSVNSLIKIEESPENDDKVIVEELSTNENEITTTSLADSIQKYEEKIESIETKISVDDITSKNKTSAVIKEEVKIPSEDESNVDLNSYECEVCTQNFSENEDYLNHIKTHQKSKKTGLKQKRKPYTKKIHIDDEGMHLCEYCFAKFSNPSDLKEHLTEHKNEDRPYKCSFENCSSQFKSKYILRNHLRTHSKLKRYKCRYCEHRVHMRSNLSSHERMHTGERPHICPYCKKAFAESGNLKSHIRFHTGEKPYKCDVCNKSFKTPSSHKIHVRTHTKERPYLCNECNKSFVTSGRLLLHTRIHSGYRPHQCTLCPASFIDSSNLKRHSKVHSTKDHKK